MATQVIQIDQLQTNPFQPREKVKKGELDEAIAAYRKALHLKPDAPAILTNLGVALAAKGAQERPGQRQEQIGVERAVFLDALLIVLLSG